MDGLEKFFDDLFLGKLPPMSDGGRETTAKVLPWVIIVFGVLGAMMWLGTLKLVFGFAGLIGAAGLMPNIFVMAGLVIAPVVQAIQLYGGYLMLSRKRKGWRLVYYGLLFGFLMQILNVSIIGLVITFIFAYLLFQVKAYFTVEG